MYWLDGGRRFPTGGEAVPKGTTTGRMDCARSSRKVLVAGYESDCMYISYCVNCALTTGYWAGNKLQAARLAGRDRRNGGTTVLVAHVVLGRLKRHAFRGNIFADPLVQINLSLGELRQRLRPP